MATEDFASRAKAFALMLKYGHDLLDAKTVEDAAALGVSNSRGLLNFTTSTLLELVNGKAIILAQYGQVAVNPHSRLAVLQCKLAESLKFDGEPLTMTKANGLLPELAGDCRVYLCLHLAPPANTDGAGFSFVWLIEYENDIPTYAVNTAKLLAISLSEALHYQKLCKNRLWNVKRHAKKRWGWAMLLLLLIGAMFLRVPENATAEFTLKAPEITSGYAWFDGPIAKCIRQDGSFVKKGDVVAEYDASQLEYRLGAAKSQLQETEAEFSLEQQNAFSDQSRLGQVKLLEARLTTMKVSVKEAEWYLAHAKIFAPSDGILALADGRAEQLAGKAVRTGDKLFDIMGGNGMTAEIPVNERDASILQKQLSATLFLHTAPETAIPVTILDVSHYPELTEQRTYCYKVRVRLPDHQSNLRYGMRGVAKISGGTVFLGYHLFKS
ncbi:MAG: HlyD family efflux transporter periplasmic adaptor subunit, partial [Victivallaceae bacterium]|nr:HlyD family efflux transporter periplasmic adaptor subunit [Victivallaceae bacterium]